MTNEVTATPTTEEELNDMLQLAVSEGNTEEIDRLMAVDLPASEAAPVEPKELEEEETATEGGHSVESSGDKEEAAPAPEANAASTPENVATNTDEVDALKRELHKLRSDAGRIPFVQSRMKELERELREVKLSRKAEAANNATADPEKIKAVEVPSNLKKRIDDLREVDPSLADLLEDMTKSLRSETHETTARVISSFNETERDLEEQRTTQTQYEALVAEVPWAPQAFQSQEWKDWKNQLTPGRRAMAESMYADDVKIALSAFAQDMQARHGNAPSVNAAQAPQPTTPNPESERIKQERERKLANGSTSKAPVAKATQTLDPEAYFKDVYAQIQKDNPIG